jgi:ankyrin repeat protein
MQNMSELHVAAYNADVDAVRALLNAREDPDSKDKDGYTPLYWCCFRGLVGDQLPVARALLDAGADPDVVPNGAVDTPLTTAIQSGNTALVRLLLERGASPNFVTSQGVSPLMAAGREGSGSIARVLLEHGASRDTRCEGFSASDYARHYGHDTVARLIETWESTEP